MLLLSAAEVGQSGSFYGFDLRKCSGGGTTQTRQCQVSDYSGVTAAAAAATFHQQKRRKKKSRRFDDIRSEVSVYQIKIKKLERDTTQGLL